MLIIQDDYESMCRKSQLYVWAALGHGQLIPWMADFSRANLVQSVGRGSKNKKKSACLNFSLSLTIGVGRLKKKKLGSHFYFSIGGIFIASVDPPSRESTDHGLMLKSSSALDENVCFHNVVSKESGSGIRQVYLFVCDHFLLCKLSETHFGQS